jgi:O-antigen/teichoic acid export membrane protein
MTPSAETDASSVIIAAKPSLYDRAASLLTYSALKAKFAKGSLTTHGLLSIGSQLAWGAQGFITFVMAGRLLPQKELGFIVVANAILFGGQCLLLGPITNPTLRFGAVSDKSVRVTYWMYCAVTGIVCSAFVLLSKQLGRLIYTDPAFFTLIKYLSIPFATTTFYAVQKLVLFARTHYKIVLMMDILYAASNIAILILLHANAMLSSAIWFYMARSGAALVGLFPVVCLFIWSKRAVGSRIEEPFAYKEYLQHSKYSSISMLSSYAQGQVDTLAVAHFLTPLSAATYGAAKIFYTGITMVTTGLTMVVLPASSRIAASGKGGLGTFYRRALLLAYALLLPSVAILAVLARPLLQLFFGSRYADAAPIVRIFCLAALVIPVSSITDSVANGAGWWRHACVAAITGGVIGMAASLYLTRVLGLSGAALAPVLALGGSSCVIAWLTWGRLSTSSPALSTRIPCAATLAGENE